MKGGLRFGAGRKKFTSREGLTIESWLRSQLSGGSRLATKVIEAGQDAGFSRRVIKGAKAAMGMVSFHRPGDKQWWWRDPNVPEIVMDGKVPSIKQFEEMKRQLMVMN